MEMEFDYKKMLKEGMEKMPKRVDIADRFKIPQAICETHGNKTLVKNFNEIINGLRREASHLSKYLFKELATPGNIEGSILILQTKISCEMVQKKIEEYIKEFVYCKVCGEPDTKLVKEERITFMKCDACGAKSPVKTI
jgi:translation initiation factor 2 subunit 2